MPHRRKGAVRPGKSVMCNICGKNCGKGGALKKHIEEGHRVGYDAYKLCFYGEAKTVQPTIHELKERVKLGDTFG